MFFLSRGRPPLLATGAFPFSVFLLLIAASASAKELAKSPPRVEPLFVESGEAASEAPRRTAAAAGGAAGRAVELNPNVQTASALGSGDAVRIALSDGTERTVRMTRVIRDVNGTVSLSGRLEGSRWGHFALSTTDGKSLGTLASPETGEAFEIRPTAGGGHVFTKASEVPDWECEAMEPPPVAADETVRRPNAEPLALGLPSEPVTVDVMIVYTPAARQWADANAGGIFNVISLSMAKANLVLDNSGTFLSWNLVGAVEVGYNESGDSRLDLIRLTTSESFRPFGHIWNGQPVAGYMEEVHDLRDALGADLVTMFASVQDTGGLAWILNSTAGTPEWGFNLTRVQQAATTFTHAHELGHNMGLHHHREQNFQPGPGLFSYSAGWRWSGSDGQRYASAMTYGAGSYFEDGIAHVEVAHFSNPDITHAGGATGHFAHADNARTLREIKHRVANYRQRIDVTIGEAIGQPEWEWRTGGHSDWMVGGSGVGSEGYAAQSGAIADNEESWLEATVEGPGNLEFWWRVSSEANYDFLHFYVGSEERARISGEIGWQRQTFAIPAGRRTVRWRYAKDRSVSQGGDAAWIDEIAWEPTEPGNPSTYEEWLVLAELPADQQGVLDDPGGFGIPNWHRYAFGLDPLHPEREQLPQPEIRRLPVGDYLAISFPKSPAVSDLVYFPEASSDLRHWEPLADPEFLVETVRKGEREEVVYRDRVPIGGEEKRFLRVSVFSKMGQAVGQPLRDWRSDGSSPWFVQETEFLASGQAAQSGAITHNQQTWVETTVRGPGALRFWWKVSSEDGWDFLSFLINGEKQTEIAGDVDWEQRIFFLPAGDQTVRWQYAKDGTVSEGADAGWLDQVEWEPD